MKQISIIAFLFLLLCVATGANDFDNRVQTEEHLINFSEVPNTWINFDYESRKWICSGSKDYMYQHIEKYCNEFFMGQCHVILLLIEKCPDET